MKIRKLKIPFYYQEKSWTCGAASLRMALESLDIKKSENQVVNLLRTNKIRGSYHKNFPLVAEKFKLSYIVERNSSIKEISKLLKDNWILIINYYDKKEKVDHYVVVNKIDKTKIYFNDPWYKEDRNESMLLSKFSLIWYDAEKEKRWLFGLKKQKEEK
ncbi:MAG: peptidase C39 family protein [Candidatus Falkowbacteria bacterium]